MNCFNRVLMSAVAVAGLSLVARGTTYYVSPTGDGTAPTAGFATGYPDIQTAITAASANDTVLLDKTTFTLTAAIEVNKAITLCGAGENWETVLDGNKGDWQILNVTVANATVHSLTCTGCEKNGLTVSV